MKSVLLKLDDELLAQTESLVKEVKTSRANYIKRALEFYNSYISNKKLEEQLAWEVALLKKADPDKALKRDFELASLTDLQKHLADED